MAQRQARTEPRSTMAFVLSIGMHVAFFVVLFFAISWKTKPPAPVVAELWTPPPAAVPRPAPKPEPKPSPKIAPPPEPKVEVKPPEKVDIALEQEKEKERKRLEEERKRLEALEQKRRKEEEARKREEAEKKRKEEAARAEAEQKRKEDEARAKAEQEKKAQQERIAADKRLAAELERETRERMSRDLAKAATPTQPGSREGASASVPGDPNALAGYRDKISAKIRGNVVLPPTVSGDPEAEFLVQQLPTGEILSVKLTRSSGSKALDDAWERAILKSSPLPLPEQREIFQSTLRLKFRPSDKR